MADPPNPPYPQLTNSSQPQLPGYNPRQPLLGAPVLPVPDYSNRGIDPTGQNQPIPTPFTLAAQQYPSPETGYQAASYYGYDGPPPTYEQSSVPQSQYPLPNNLPPPPPPPQHPPPPPPPVIFPTDHRDGPSNNKTSGYANYPPPPPVNGSDPQQTESTKLSQVETVTTYGEHRVLGQQDHVIVSEKETIIIDNREPKKVRHCLHCCLSVVFPPWLIVWICLCICYS